MQKILMILGAGKNEVPVIKKAREMGVRTVVCDMNENAPGLKHGDFNVVAKSKDPLEYLEIAEKHKINGILTVSVEALVRTISFIAEKKGLAGISRQAALNVTNKALMKKVLKENNISTSNFVSAKFVDEAAEKIKGLKFPLVIKPVDRAGSRGVVKLEERSDLGSFFDKSLSESACGEVIIEEFVDGIESTIDSITYGNRTYVLGISDKEKIHTPNIISMDLTFPPRYPESVQKEVKRVVKSALKALGLEFGPSHIEVIVDDSGPKVIEVAARGGGGLIPSDILPHLCGFDVMEKYIKLALGEDPSALERELTQGAVLRFFKAPDQGVLKNISGIEEAKKIEGVMKIDFIIKEGDVLRPLTEDNDRVGFVITKGRTRREARALADRVEKAIKFNLK